MADIAVETKTYEDPKAPVVASEPAVEPAKAPEPEAKAAPEQQEAPESEAQDPEESAELAPDGQEDTKAEGEKKKSSKDEMPAWFQKRMNQMTRKNGDLQRELLQAKIELEAAKKSPGQPKVEGEDGHEAPSQPASEGNIQDLIRAEAARLVQAEKFKSNVDTIMKEGYGKYPDFENRCNFLADLGATDNPNFMATIADLDNGHDVIASLAESPEDAQRLFSLPPNKQALELGRMSAKLSVAPAKAEPKKEAKTFSSAPAPIKPIDGTAKATTAPSPDDDDAAWFAKRMKQRDEKKLGRGARF